MSAILRITILSLISLITSAQTALNFSKRFVQSEDKWVAFKPNKDSSYTYGFVYIDENAGLTFNYEGTFIILPTGQFLPKKPDSIGLKVRLEPNNVLVAFIPEDRFRELDIPAIPEWLKRYKTDTTSVSSLYNRGYMYNGWGECAKALTYLERAAKSDPGYKGLAVELSFSYNCLHQYNKAEAILVEEIKTNPQDAYVNKEYIYTLVKNNKITEAASQFNTSVNKIKDKKYNAENCYNILQYYYFQKDKTGFNNWYEILQHQPNASEMITRYANSMKAELNK